MKKKWPKVIGIVSFVMGVGMIVLASTLLGQGNAAWGVLFFVLGVAYFVLGYLFIRKPKKQESALQRAKQHRAEREAAAEAERKTAEEAAEKEGSDLSEFAEYEEAVRLAEEAALDGADLEIPEEKVDDEPIEEEVPVVPEFTEDSAVDKEEEVTTPVIEKEAFIEEEFIESEEFTPEEFTVPEEFAEPEEFTEPEEFAPEEFTEPEEFVEPHQFIEPEEEPLNELPLEEVDVSEEVEEQIEEDIGEEMSIFKKKNDSEGGQEKKPFWATFLEKNKKIADEAGKAEENQNPAAEESVDSLPNEFEPAQEIQPEAPAAPVETPVEEEDGKPTASSISEIWTKPASYEEMMNAILGKETTNSTNGNRVDDLLADALKKLQSAGVVSGSNTSSTDKEQD